MTRHRTLLLTAVAVLALVSPRALWAHAILMHSTPAVNGTASPAGFAIELHYNSRVDGSRSRLTLTTKSDVSGKTFPLDKLTQTAPATLSSASGALAPGEYMLHWIVLASDGHISRGEIPFTVK
jgi:copper resistance protein C